MAVLMNIDSGDLEATMENLNGFAGCYDVPYVSFDMTYAKYDLREMNIQEKGRWYIALLILHCILIIVNGTTIMWSICELRKPENNLPEHLRKKE